MNTYAYGNGNPVGFVDVDGRIPIFLPEIARRAVHGVGAGAIEVGVQLALNGGRWDCIDWWDVAEAALMGALGMPKNYAKKMEGILKYAKNGQKAKSGGNKLLGNGPKLHPGQQGKHQPGHNNFDPNKSPLTHKDPQGLLDSHAGKGQPVGSTPVGQPGSKEVVDFGEVIGTVGGQPTTMGTIYYGAKGAHIVPRLP